MRTIATRVYTARELKRYQKEGFVAALERYRENVREDTYSMDEIMDSLKGLFKAAGVKMRDWEIGAYAYSHLEVEFGEDRAVAELTGARAFAWIENNLLAQFRAPWGLPKLKAGAPLPEGFTRSWEAPSAKYKHGCLHSDDSQHVTRWAKPGERRECPFTGVCYDEDFIDALMKALREGDTLEDAFQGLADEARRLIEGEDEYAREESAFLEAADANGWEYTKSGKMV